MTPTEINRACAELCGARDIRISNRWEVTDPPDAPCVDVGLFANGIRAIPDYFHSLDACAEFERTIKDWGKYFGTIARIICGCANDIAHSTRVSVPTSVLWQATAPQRCEAFLRMHGKWRDE